MQFPTGQSLSREETGTDVATIYFGTAVVASGVALKEWIDANNITGNHQNLWNTRQRKLEEGKSTWPGMAFSREWTPSSTGTRPTEMPPTPLPAMR
jgi:hypothetical protein